MSSLLGGCSQRDPKTKCVISDSPAVFKPNDPYFFPTNGIRPEWRRSLQSFERLSASTSYTVKSSTSIDSSPADWNSGFQSRPRPQVNCLPSVNPTLYSTANPAGIALAANASTQLHGRCLPSAFRPLHPLDLLAVQNHPLDSMQKYPNSACMIQRIPPTHSSECSASVPTCGQTATYRFPLCPPVSHFPVDYHTEHIVSNSLSSNQSTMDNLTLRRSTSRSFSSDASASTTCISSQPSPIPISTLAAKTTPSQSPSGFTSSPHSRELTVITSQLNSSAASSVNTWNSALATCSLSSDLSFPTPPSTTDAPFSNMVSTASTSDGALHPRAGSSQESDHPTPLPHLNMRHANVLNYPKYSNRRNSGFERRLKHTGLILDPKLTLRLLRKLLQPFINRAVDKVLQNYMNEFVLVAVRNIRTNLGEHSVTNEDLLNFQRSIMHRVALQYLHRREPHRDATAHGPDKNHSFSDPTQIHPGKNSPLSRDLGRSAGSEIPLPRCTLANNGATNPNFFDDRRVDVSLPLSSVLMNPPLDASSKAVTSTANDFHSPWSKDLARRSPCDVDSQGIPTKRNKLDLSLPTVTFRRSKCAVADETASDSSECSPSGSPNSTSSHSTVGFFHRSSSSDVSHSSNHGIQPIHLPANGTWSTVVTMGPKAPDNSKSIDTGQEILHDSIDELLGSDFNIPSSRVSGVCNLNGLRHTIIKGQCGIPVSGAYTTTKSKNGISRLRIKTQLKNLPEPDCDTLSTPEVTNDVAHSSSPAWPLESQSVQSDECRTASTVPQRHEGNPPSFVLNPCTVFTLGSSANTWLGLGAARGRIYTKHPELFRYLCDSEDKAWLVRNGYLTSHGVKAYLMSSEQVRYIAEMDGRSSPPNGSTTKNNNLPTFTVPTWLLLKIKSSAVIHPLYRNPALRDSPSTNKRVNTDLLPLHPSSSVPQSVRSGNLGSAEVSFPNDKSDCQRYLEGALGTHSIHTTSATGDGSTPSVSEPVQSPLPNALLRRRCRKPAPTKRSRASSHSVPSESPTASGHATHAVARDVNPSHTSEEYVSHSSTSVVNKDSPQTPTPPTLQRFDYS